MQGIEPQLRVQLRADDRKLAEGRIHDSLFERGMTAQHDAENPDEGEQQREGCQEREVGQSASSDPPLSSPNFFTTANRNAGMA